MATDHDLGVRILSDAPVPLQSTCNNGVVEQSEARLSVEQVSSEHVGSNPTGTTNADVVKLGIHACLRNMWPRLCGFDSHRQHLETGYYDYITLTRKSITLIMCTYRGRFCL
jgi:hypothetical protein